jgi:8-oxo-dGTP pyrophosphatase MutT (NUDIX family)
MDQPTSPDAPRNGGIVASGPAPAPREFRQRVTRPELAELGEPPPWRGRVASGGVSVSVEQVRACLPEFDPDELVRRTPRSAVLVPIVERHGGCSVLLTRRAATLSLDAGNVSFPGGHIESGEHPLDAALREAEEEIGLAPSEVEILGSLDLVERARDGQRVVSVVGLIRGTPHLVANEGEVAAILEAPLGALFAEEASWREHWGEARRPIHFFTHPLHLGDDLVWGLTARILWDLLERVARGIDGP